MQNKQRPLALIMTDTHLSDKNIEVNKSIFKQFFDCCKLYKPEYTIHMGDMFDDRKSQKLITLKTMKNMLEGLTQPLFVIPGNHDKSDLSSKESFLDIYHDDEENNLIVIDDYWIDPTKRLHLIPFFSNNEYNKRLDLVLENVIKNSDSKKFLLTHIAIDGVRNNDGSIVSDSISRSKLTLFDKVLVGHYHDRSVIGNNVHYTGSAFQHNFGENTDKGFTLLYPNGQVEYIKTQFPSFIQYKIDIDESNLNTNQIVDELCVSIKDEDNTNVRVTFIGKETNLKKIQDKGLKNIGVDVKYIPKEVMIGVESAENEEFINFESRLDDEWNNYSKLTKLSKEQVKIGLELLQK